LEELGSTPAPLASLSSSAVGGTGKRRIRVEGGGRKSTPRLAKELAEQGHQVSQRSVCDLLAQLDYSLQSTRKTGEGGQHPDRDAQFNHIARMAAQHQAAGDPVISVDTKKKELVVGLQPTGLSRGDFKNGGREWQPKGDPEQVGVHDFIDPARGKSLPLRKQGWRPAGSTMALPSKAG
jgi:hypothetical protein